MSTAYPNRPKQDVGGRERPRTRPRVGAVCVWPYYVGATHVTSAAGAGVKQSPTSPPTSLADMGGQYAPAIGDSTRDVSDAEDTAARLADFNAAREVIRFGTVADVAW
ncbi:MAG: hypothetical protein U0805_11435 [Pirellulales bacterium]